jgi:hypothetical protein
MKRYSIVAFFIILTAVVVVSAPSWAVMASSSYQIPTSVISGGGIHMGSTSFEINSSLGQSSPITGPILSTNFRVESGFWNSIYYSKDSKGLPWLILLLD